MTSCLATVRQRGMVFTPGPHMHCHRPIVGVYTAAKVTRDIKKKAMNDYYQPAGMIVEQVLLEQLGPGPCPAIPKVANLARQANRKRQKSRPVEPSDLEFELNPSTCLVTSYRLMSRLAIGATWFSAPVKCLCWQNQSSGII